MSSIGRIGAILLKELQDFRTNMNILFMYFIPILLVYIYGNVIPDMPKGLPLGFGLLFLVVMVGMYVPAMTIAEEKEKKTLEVLMLSPATAVEVFIGKGLLTFITMFVTLIVLLFVSGNGFQSIGVILLGTLLTALFCILLGMVVGLFSQNQMSTGVVGTPIYLILMLIPMLAGMGVGAIESIARVLPTFHYFRMLEMALFEGKGLEAMLLEIGVLAVSVAVAFALLMLVYKKRGME